MAWHRSRIKRMKQAKKNRNRNVSAKKTIKATTKEILALINGKKAKESQELLEKVKSTYATTAKRGIITKNSASRKISRLTKKVNTLQKASA